MQFQWVAGIFALCSLITLLIALFMLLRRNWFAGWLKGMIGMLALVASVVLGLTALNLNGYKLLNEEVTVATISFDKIDKQLYKANVVLQGNAVEMPFEIAGDLWQMDARIIKWKGPFAALGGTPLYKLDRLQGRYYALEDERIRARSVYAVSNPDVGFDLWTSFKTLSRHFPWFDAEYGSATYLPMADGALFSVRLTFAGMIARPENDRAEMAVKEWD
jgi:hypothetical protein